MVQIGTPRGSGATLGRLDSDFLYRRIRDAASNAVPIAIE